MGFFSVLFGWLSFLCVFTLPARSVYVQILPSSETGRVGLEFATTRALVCFYVLFVVFMFL